FEKEPFESRFAFRLIECYKRLGEFTKIQKILDGFLKAAKNELLTKEEIKELKLALPEDISDEEKQKLSKQKMKKIKKNKSLNRGIIQIKLVEGEIFEYQGKMKKALEKYVELEKIATKSENVLIRIANLYLKIGENNKAIEYFNKILALNPDNHMAFYGLALSYYNLKDYDNSVEFVLDSINLIYYNSEAHWLLGESLHNMGVVDKAVDALNVALAISPSNSKARNRLIEIYQKDLNEPNKVKILKDFYKKKDSENKAKSEENKIYKSSVNLVRSNINLETIYIVSGLPRSGTSLIMQMLEKAGMKMFVDNHRKADESNPKGYFEHEAVKSISRNKAWINQAVGKVVKVVSHLLFHLPANYHYKIVFADRDLNQIITSQQKMLEKNGKVSKASHSITLEMSYQKNLQKVDQWAKNHHNIEILHVEHSKLINNGFEEAKKIVKFLEINAQAEEMAKVIDKKLHRTK
ncbi:MAG: tetratricopeptide repeat protein, partial [Bacteroidota bacterium]|nr:tetratricopeptide repeat protein [Bacteroidota bacterium]